VEVAGHGVRGGFEFCPGEVAEETVEGFGGEVGGSRGREGLVELPEFGVGDVAEGFAEEVVEMVDLGGVEGIFGWVGRVVVVFLDFGGKV